MLSVSQGYDTSYLTDAVATGREEYYSAAVDAGEPAGVWYGSGAEALRLSGTVDADLMEALYHHLLDPRDPAAADRATWAQARLMSDPHKHYKSPEELYTRALKGNPQAGPEQRAEMRHQAEQAARQAVAFLDATFSAPKTWSVAAVAFERASNLAYEAGDLQEAAYWEERHRTLEDAMMVGARASIDYLQEHAGYGRVGKFGAGSGQWTDAHSWVVAQFLQHDSREHDPQLHVHQAILNRQLCADGKWRALDSTAIRNWKAGAGAVAERSAEAYATQRAGIQFRARADGVAREIVGVDQQLAELFSKRSAQIDPLVTARGEEFRARYGREPSAHEWTKLAQQATLETRAAKRYGGESQGERMDRWVAETRAAVGQDLAATAEAVVDAAAAPREAVQWSPADVKARALAEIGRGRAVWRESDLTRAVDRALPSELAVPDAADVRTVLEGLTKEALAEAIPARAEVQADDAPAELKLADGRSVYEPPGARTWSTPDQVVGERLLREAAVKRGAPALSHAQAQAVRARYAENGVELTAGQARALTGVLTSGAMVETIAAPAGTGKSFLLGAISEAWHEAGYQMFGLATTQNAAEVLADEGLTSRNVAQWLAAQQRLAQGRGSTADAELALRPGAIVAVDEASMTSWPDMVAVQQVCDAAGAKLLPVGDPHQIGSVGPGGALADAVEHGIAYELTEVRRFTEQWEAAASLKLRAGDRAAIGEYSKHGRLVAGGSVEGAEQAATRGWLADTLAGKESLLLCGSNAEAARLSAQLRAELVAMGKVAPDGVPLGLQGTTAGVGDLVQARRNAWDLKGWEGNTQAPVNRQTYEVTGVRADGGLTVRPVLAHDHNGRQLGDDMQLPGNYVDRHMALGYASTAHAAEGRTVDSGHCLYGTGMDAAGLLVSMTRGRERNTGYAVTRPEPATGTSAPGEVAQVKQRTAEAVLGDLLDRAEIERGALAAREQAERDAASAITNGDRLIDGISRCTAARTSAALDQLVADGTLDAHDRARMAADPAAWSVDAILRRAELAGHDPVKLLAQTVSARGFDDAAAPAATLYSRLSESLRGQSTQAVGSFADLIPADIPERWRPWLERHAAAVDERRLELGTQAAIERPQWAVEALGEVPEDPVERLDWEDKAGVVATYRELVGHEDPANALGAAPPAGLPEKNAMWRAAHATLDLPASGPAEQEASEGLLRAQVAAWQREEAWAPRYVADELAAVSREAAKARETATVLGAKAAALAATDPEQAAVLRAEVAQAAQRLPELEAQEAALEQADLDRAVTLAHTAATRARAEAAGDELAARGIDLANPPDAVTTEQWLAAHRAAEAELEAATTDVGEHEVADPELEGDRAQLDAEPVQLGPVEQTGLAETAVPDIRDTTVPDAHEHADPEQRRRVPAMAETRETVARAQEAVTEVKARAQLDAAADAEQFELTAPAPEVDVPEQQQAVEQPAVEYEPVS